MRPSRNLIGLINGCAGEAVAEDYEVIVPSNWEQRRREVKANEHIRHVTWRSTDPVRMRQLDERRAQTSYPPEHHHH